MSNRGHGGRRSKGPRVQKTLRSPEPIAEAAILKAENLGYDFNDYVTWLMAVDVGMEELAPRPTPRADQGVLPIGKGDVRLAQSA